MVNIRPHHPILTPESLTHKLQIPKPTPADKNWPPSIQIQDPRQGGSNENRSRDDVKEDLLKLESKVKVPTTPPDGGPKHVIIVTSCEIHLGDAVSSDTLHDCFLDTSGKLSPECPPF